MEDNTEIIDWYLKHKSLYRTLAKKVESIIVELLELGGNEYHATSSREKDVESFSKKIIRKEYSNPKIEMTDLSGVRIITYVESQIEPIRRIIEDNFNIDWEKSSDKSEDLGIDKVGYKSVHYVGQLKENRLELPEYQRLRDLFFEIQIRTILQHAWAEIEHDRNYKFSGVLPKKIQRRFMLLAGLLESADSEFNSISIAIDGISDNVNKETKKGNLDILINSTTLKEYLRIKFSKLGDILEHNFISNKREILIINELEKFGWKKLEDIDKNIPDNFIENIKKNVTGTNYNGITTWLMIINNPDKFFHEVWDKDHWSVLSLQTKEFLEKIYSIQLNKYFPGT
ncbi:GTP pyrophosphokinase family protein [Flavobacterium qiangtangense]|uniref:GTP pyrophosphokinase family protein n=1 Tax=Flavobacterium qiangtangense TaxID=1442595 RepID=A0ABW1PJA8_9FLAO